MRRIVAQGQPRRGFTGERITSLRDMSAPRIQPRRSRAAALRGVDQLVWAN